MTTLPFARIRMPHAAPAIAPAPLALGVAAEPCTPAMRPASAKRGGDLGGLVGSDAGGRHLDSFGGNRFGDVARSNSSSWYRQDTADLTGGGPLRG